MKVGIAGLGLIGGSMAKAVKKKTEHTVLVLDNNENVINSALEENVADGVLNKDTVADCDVLIIALYPDSCLSFLEEYAPFIPKHCIVFDCAGTKTKVCNCGFKLSKKYGFCFIGAHPMAGIEKSGYEFSFADLFNGASFIIVPKEDESKNNLNFIEIFALSLGFGRITKTTAEIHDKTIAYTSQLAHVASSAYIKSPAAQLHAGFSAGSFKDLTRVAYLNESMWSQLFLENKEFLVEEINILLEHLTQYRDAIKNNDRETLFALLKDGKEKKVSSESEG